MVIDRDISSYTVHQDVSLDEALRRINSNKSQIVFTVDDAGKLVGVMSDGDFRRWVMANQDIDLSRPVRSVALKKVVVGQFGDRQEKLASMFTDAVRILPLVDKYGHLVAIARPEKSEIRIANRLIGEGHPALIVAEIGNNHNGDFEMAKLLVDKSVASGADCVKFQMRQLNQTYRKFGNLNGDCEDLGTQYTLDNLNRFSLCNDDLLRIFDYCHDCGIEPLCTPWDIASVDILERYGIRAFKIASADLTYHDLVQRVSETRRPMLLSTGMSTEQEIAETVDLLSERGAIYVLLHCNSTYPAPYKDINLAYLTRLAEIGRCLVGYSGHERGIHIAIAAIPLGAKVIEKHLTLDKSLEGSDHKASLLPGEFQALVSGIRQVEESMGTAKPRSISQGEMINREVLAKSIVAKRSIVEGETITAEMLDMKSPGRGIQPNRRATVIGRRAARNIRVGDFIYPENLDHGRSGARRYRFDRPWGIPVRYHDFEELVTLSNPDFVEFHLSYRDLELDFRNYIHVNTDLDFVVHCPELFRNDHVLDLCSPDDEHRQLSIRHLQRVIDLTNAMKSRFIKTSRPMIVTNVGGFSQDANLPPCDTETRKSILLESLDRLDTTGVEILPQTMPPFPWHFGGQRFHNLFVDSESIATFCRDHGYRVCLDISHAKLACNQFNWSLNDYIAQLIPHVAHLHISDAIDVASEGLQILDGEIDFASVSALLADTAPNIGFIPEVWQGHANGGEGFWIALERLERWFGPSNLVSVDFATKRNAS